jgi:hypothetical protein
MRIADALIHQMIIADAAPFVIPERRGMYQSLREPLIGG